MLVSEILRIKGTVLFTTPPDAPVMDAVKVMAQLDIGSLVVMDHGELVRLTDTAAPSPMPPQITASHPLSISTNVV